MYLILVYDVGEKRVAKVCKYLRTVLTWVQNSVFEGEVTKAQLAKIKSRLAKIMVSEEDNILFYIMSAEKWIERDQMGTPKNDRTNFL